MRLSALEIAGFRGFGESHKFDLDADAVILAGPNGQGKTSFFDAILWAITGTLPRLRAHDQALVSLYSPTGQCRVAVVGRDVLGREVRIDRSFDGTEQLLQVAIDGAVLRGGAAAAKIIEVLWPAATYTSEPNQALAGALTRAVYLQQDVIRQFIESDDQERFNAVGELLGVGRVTELQVQLERARTAWSRATNQRTTELSELTARLNNLTQKQTELKSIRKIAPRLTNDWAQWWPAFKALGGDVVAPESPTDSLARSALGAAIRQSQAIGESSLRRARELETLLADMESAAAPTVDTEDIRQAVAQAEARLNSARETLKGFERTASEERARQTAAKEKDEQVRALAQLALRLLGEVCPVCGQQYDVVATRNKLTAILQRTATPSPVLEDPVLVGARNVKALEDEVQKLRSDLHDRERIVRAAEVARRQLSERWKLLMPGHDTLDVDVLRAELREAQRRAAAATDASNEGERLTLVMLQVAEQAREVELASQILALTSDIREKEDELRRRERTGDLATKILDGLREASSEIVRKELERIAPVLQRVYARVDPHPALTAVSLLATFQRGRGRLSALLQDTAAQVHADVPGQVLSSSQMNALAVCVFLTLNLTVPRLPFRAALLDDPIQSLDDINLLGLIDLLRRTRDRRQLIVSTHDNRFARLLERKLRPVGEHQRTMVITFAGWRRSGPVVTQKDVPIDASPLRIAV